MSGKKSCGKDYRCARCVCSTKREKCTESLWCMVADGHSGECTGPLAIARLTAEVVKIDVKAWMRKVATDE